MLRLSRPRAILGSVLLLAVGGYGCSPSGQGDESESSAARPAVGSTASLDVVTIDHAGLDPAIVTLFGRLEAEVRAAPEDGAARGRLGLAYEANRSYGPAERCYEQAQQLDPDEAKWWYHAALARSNVGDVPGALARMDSALARHEGYGPAWWRRGEWLLAGGDLDGAEASFRKATDVRPNHPSGWLGRARIHLQRGEPAKAERILLDAIERRPNGMFVSYLHQLLGTVYRQMGRLDEAREQLARGRAGRPAWSDPWRAEMDEYLVSLESRLTELRLAMEAGQVEEVVPELDQLVRQHPEHATVHTYHGVALQLAGRPADAKRALETAVGLDPEDPQSWEALADARSALGDRATALEAVDEALRLNPRRPSAHHRRGNLLVQQGRRADAVEAWQRVLDHDPKHTGALAALARDRVSNAAWPEASAFWERVLVVEPWDLDACLGVAQAEIERGDVAKAVPYLDRAAEIAPDDPRITALRRRT